MLDTQLAKATAEKIFSEIHSNIDASSKSVSVRVPIQELGENVYFRFNVAHHSTKKCFYVSCGYVLVNGSTQQGVPFADVLAPVFKSDTAIRNTAKNFRDSLCMLSKNSIFDLINKAKPDVLDI